MPRRWVARLLPVPGVVRQASRPVGGWRARRRGGGSSSSPYERRRQSARVLRVEYALAFNLFLPGL